MEGLQKHAYAPESLKENPDAVSPIDASVQRIVQLVNESKSEEAATAYAEEVAKLSASEATFDIKAFNERVTNAGVSINYVDEAADPVASDAEQGHEYPPDQLENVKHNLRSRLDAVRGNISGENATDIETLIDNAARRRAVDSISDALHAFEVAQDASQPKPDAQEEVRKLQQIEREEMPYPEDQREHAKNNLRNYVERLGLPDEQAQAFKQHIDAIQAPEDTIVLVRALRKIERKLSRIKRTEEAAPIPPQEPDVTQQSTVRPADVMNSTMHMGSTDFQPVANGGGAGAGESPIPGAEATGDNGRQNIGEIAVNVPGQYVSWRNPNPLRYDGIPMKTTRDVLSNKREQQLFMELIDAIGGDQKDEARARLERYTLGTTTQDDRDFVTYATKEFSRSLKFAEDAASEMKSEDIELFARRNKDLDNILTQEGSVRAQEIIKNSILHMAMRKPEETMALVKNLKQLNADRSTGRYERWNTEVQKLCEAAGIKSVSNFDAVYNMDERAASREQVRGRVRESMNKFEKSMDFVAERFGLSKTDRLMKRADWVVRMKQKTFASPMSWKISSVDEGLANITGFLGETVGNDEVRSLVAREVTENKNFELASEGGPRSFAEMQQLSNSQFSEQSIGTRIRQRMQQPDWPADQAGQDKVIGDMKTRESQAQQGKGFFAWLFSVVFGKNFDKAASAALNRPVHV